MQDITERIAAAKPPPSSHLAASALGGYGAAPLIVNPPALYAPPATPG